MHLGRHYLENFEELAILWYALLLAGLNLPVTLNYFGPAISLAYVAGIGSVVILLQRLNSKISGYIVVAALIGSLIAQIFLLYAVAPVYDMRLDRDDALLFWWERLFEGRYPYAESTSLGNPISILPGLHVLALPFILLGNVGVVVPATFCVLVVLLWWYYRDLRQARNVILIVLAAAPIILLEAAGRSELILNATILCVVIVMSKSSNMKGNAYSMGIGIMLGILVATRMAIWPTLLPITGYLAAKTKRRHWLFILFTATITSSLFIIPFAVWDPDVFFNYAPFGVNMTKLGAERDAQLLWIFLTTMMTMMAIIIACRTPKLFMPVILVLATVILSTWIAFFYDVTYVQLIFIPTLFLYKELSG